MTLLKLAVRNLRSAGLRTWLNSIALSFAFVAIVFGQGMLEGVNRQAEQATVAASIGGGQYWHPEYDPFDPLTLERAHAPLPRQLQELVASGRAVAVLAVPGSIYHRGRLRPVIIKGIAPDQRLLAMPTRPLADTTAYLPILLGARAARSAGLHLGDQVTVQWRNSQGTLDTCDGMVVEIMETSVTAIDIGQLWVPLHRLQELASLPGEATFVTVARGLRSPPQVAGWQFRTPSYLLSDLRQVIRSKTAGQAVMFSVLFLLAMLAIFDTQVLSLFRRRREIGMLIALGMTHAQVIVLFTLEGALHSLLAAALGAAYGAPLFFHLSRHGFRFPGGDAWGYALGERLYPAFSAQLLLFTTVLLFVTTAFVAWLPTRRIARLKPAALLTGRMS